MSIKIPKDAIESALRAGSISAAASMLGISKTTLRDQCKRLGLSPDGKRYVPDTEYRFKAGSYHNKCATPMCGGAPLRSGVCIYCYTVQRKERVADVR